MSAPLHAVSAPLASGQPPRSLIVFLHGWGANAQDLVSVAPYLNLPGVQFVFPEAPFPHPYSSVGRMWYELPQDYRFLGTAEFGDRPDVTDSRQRLLDFLTGLASTTNIGLNQMILAGFSQGGAMTLDVGLRLPLAGLMVLSGYLHAPIQSPIKPSPVLLVHGTQDQVVPLALAHQARTQLTRYNIPVEYHEFVMGHEIQSIVLQKIQVFAQQCFASS